MLIEGSEEVIQNGITLKRGLDYNIDYFTGTIVLLGDAANDPNAKLKVNYDKHELVSFDKKTIFRNWRFRKNVCKISCFKSAHSNL